MLKSGFVSGEGVVVRRGEVVTRVRELIERHAPGDALPSERVLSERIGVSRPTLRAALDELAAVGLVVRRHGQGTFVQQVLPAGGVPVPPASGDWASQVLEFGVVRAGAKLGLSPDAEVVRALRLRIVDGRPMALEEIHLAAGLLPRITRDDFASGSLYQRLREIHGLTPADAVQTTEPTVTDAGESRLLDVPLHSPALQFARTSRDTRGRTFEYTRSVYRGDRYRITSHLTFGPESG